MQEGYCFVDKIRILKQSSIDFRNKEKPQCDISGTFNNFHERSRHSYSLVLSPCGYVS